MVRFREKSQDGDLRTWMMLLVQWYDTANVDENSLDRWLKGDIKGQVSSGSLAILDPYAPNPGTTSEADGPQMGDLTLIREQRV